MKMNLNEDDVTNRPTMANRISTSIIGTTVLTLGTCLCVVTGCVSSGPKTSPPEASTSAIVLSKAQTLPVTYGTTTLPAGEYRPVYRTEEGVFYAAPTSLFFALNASGKVLWGYLVDTPIEGGVCIVKDKAGGEMHGVWVDPSYEKHEDLPTRMARGDHPARKGCYMRLLQGFEYRKAAGKE